MQKVVFHFPSTFLRNKYYYFLILSLLLFKSENKNTVSVFFKVRLFFIIEKKITKATTYTNFKENSLMGRDKFISNNWEFFTQHY